MRVVLCLLLLLGIAVSGEARAAEVCQTPVYTVCTNEGGATAGGISLTSHCTRYAGTQNCVDTAPLDQCEALSASSKCSRTSQTCVEYKNGDCRQWRSEFSCLNEDGDMSPAVLTRTEFGPTQEEIINHCESLDNNEECELTNTDDVEGAEIRGINGKNFSRSWWKRERTYSCLAPGEGDTTCGPLESDPTCRLEGSTCLVERDGICSNREFHYRCGVESGGLETSCEPVNVCVGDNCLGVEQETSSDFASSAAWLNVLAQMQNEYREQAESDPNDVRFFQGTVMTCSKAPGRNCCKGSGIFASTCSEATSVLRDKREAGSTHYVGVTCQQRILGACIKKRYYYCTYNSKFGRVFIEEHKEQIEQGWGAPRRENCGYVTIEDFGNIDIEEMDLSPVFGDIMGQVNVPVAEGLQDFYENRFPSAGDDAQNAFEELEQ